MALVGRDAQCRDAQGCPAVVVGVVDLRAVLQEVLHDLGVAHVGGRDQRRAALVVGAVHVVAGRCRAQQGQHDVLVATPRRGPQRRALVHVGVVDSGARLQQQIHDLAVASPGGRAQCRPAVAVRVVHASTTGEQHL